MLKLRIAQEATKYMRENNTPMLTFRVDVFVLLFIHV